MSTKSTPSVLDGKALLDKRRGGRFPLKSEVDHAKQQLDAARAAYNRGLTVVREFERTLANQKQILKTASTHTLRAEAQRAVLDTERTIGPLRQELARRATALSASKIQYDELNAMYQYALTGGNKTAEPAPVKAAAKTSTSTNATKARAKASGGGSKASAPSGASVPSEPIQKSNPVVEDAPLSFLDAAPLTNAPTAPANTAQPFDAGEFEAVGDDHRIRIAAADTASKEAIYGPQEKSNILYPLYETNGLLFPYTPAISISQDVQWQSHELTHTNYDILSYQRTPAAVISITGKFTIQNQREGEYALAAIHFLRSVSKMYFGEADQDSFDPEKKSFKNGKAGVPPPVLRLHGYGNYMFNDLRVVLKQFAFNYEETMDLVRVELPEAGGYVMLPPLFQLQLSLGIQQAPVRIRKEFSLDAFRTGALMTSSKGKGWF